MNVFTHRLRAASRYIKVHGWTQDQEQDTLGRVCLTGAIRLCALQNGDEEIIRAVLRHRGRAEDWNDDLFRTEVTVLRYLESAEITDKDLEGVFGPQWRYIVTVVRQNALVTSAQAVKIYSVYKNLSQTPARWTALEEMDDVGPDTLWMVGGIVRGPFRNALCAVAARDSILSEDFDALYGPWRTVFGEPKECTQ